MMLNVNDCLQGFKVLSKRELGDISATMYEMQHQKSGAELVYLDRDDQNKTFSIGFTTIPTDDTGVFHILEHSVLCGSDKYPVKEPFVELLKSSLNTFLNAMTYNDKTVYPVCSKNDKDFLNLVSVYMDAVLHPAMLKEPRIFRQEGWHYELDGDELSYNGVVYNEMKGAYSHVDDLAAEKLMSMLYGGSCYSKDSGGNPDFITDLTYEQFVDSHKRFYHPSNAKIVLDGSMDIESVLALLDSYLKEYDRTELDIGIEMPKSVDRLFSRDEFEISESDDEESGARILIGLHSTDCDQTERAFALSLIKDYLTGSNEAPLKKALLDSGLCRDVLCYDLGGIIKNSIVIEVRNVKEADSDRIIALVDEVLKREIDKGFDKDMLTATLNLCEFRLRELDMGSFPKGLSYALSVYDTWLYGKDPALTLQFSEMLAGARERINTDYYERLAEELLLNNNSRATLIMVPSKSLAEKKSRMLKEKLASVKASMSKEELEAIARECEQFKAWQAREDSEEELDKLPLLKLEDISSDIENIPTEKLEGYGAPILYHPIKTGGIAYASYVFDASDLTGDGLFALSLASSLMMNVKTESYDTLSLQKKSMSSFGVFAPSCTCFTDGSHEAIPAFVLKAHALERNVGEIAAMAREVLYTSELSDKETLKKIVSQIKIMSEESFIASGHTVAMQRAGAHDSTVMAANEYISGYESYLLIKKYDQDFDSLADGLIKKMQKVCQRVFVKERLTVNISCERNEELFSELVSVINSGERAGERGIKPLPPANEGIIIASPVGYASIAANYFRVSDTYSGASQVARSILNYVHLWNSVRVLGGAYGAGLVFRSTGKVSYYSYRDPSPKRTLDCFRQSADFLRKYVKENPDLTKLIIGAVGAATPIVTPRMATEMALADYFAGITYEDACRAIREIISATPEDIIKVADTLQGLAEIGCVCVVGGKEQIDSCRDELDTVLEL